MYGGDCIPFFTINYTEMSTEVVKLSQLISKDLYPAIFRPEINECNNLFQTN